MFGYGRFIHQSASCRPWIAKSNWSSAAATSSLVFPSSSCIVFACSGDSYHFHHAPRHYRSAMSVIENRALNEIKLHRRLTSFSPLKRQSEIGRAFYGSNIEITPLTSSINGASCRCIGFKMAFSYHYSASYIGIKIVGSHCFSSPLLRYISGCRHAFADNAASAPSTIGGHFVENSPRNEIFMSTQPRTFQVAASFVWWRILTTSRPGTDCKHDDAAVGIRRFSVDLRSRRIELLLSHISSLLANHLQCHYFKYAFRINSCVSMMLFLYEKCIMIYHGCYDRPSRQADTGAALKSFVILSAVSNACFTIRANNNSGDIASLMAGFLIISSLIFVHCRRAAGDNRSRNLSRLISNILYCGTLSLFIYISSTQGPAMSHRGDFALHVIINIARIENKSHFTTQSRDASWRIRSHHHK